MIHEAPVWKDAITKPRYLRKLPSALRLTNIKIAKAYRTVSFEAHCVTAGVPPIGLVIEGKVQLYKRKYGLKNSDTVCDMLQPVNKWPHPARRATVMENSVMTKYIIEMYTDGSKNGGQIGAGVAIHIDKQLVK
jgi:hypothetical protein